MTKRKTFFDAESIWKKFKQIELLKIFSTYSVVKLVVKLVDIVISYMVHLVSLDDIQGCTHRQVYWNKCLSKYLHPFCSCKCKCCNPFYHKGRTPYLVHTIRWHKVILDQLENLILIVIILQNWLKIVLSLAKYFLNITFCDGL